MSLRLSSSFLDKSLQAFKLNLIFTRVIYEEIKRALFLHLRVFFLYLSLLLYHLHLAFFKQGCEA